MELDSNHKLLVHVIRGVHRQLRNDCRTALNEEAVWNKHREDVELRRTYAEAMRLLATTVWETSSCDSRIEWCRKAWRHYFYGGGLEKCLVRDARLKKTVFLKAENTGICPPVEQKLELLDVGSCYNPFGPDEDCRCLAIDLTPATEDVFECDFLTVPVTESTNRNPKDDACQIRHLPKQHFHVVVFSLVLEYLPLATQRWRFCRKAWDVLRSDGLLLIVTPDSKHQNRNAPMIRSWKEALAKIGFQRVAYDKLKHLHCMAFRKIPGGRCLDIDTELLYIPQDFNDALPYEVEEAVERTEIEENIISQCFLELPFESDVF